MTDSIGEVLGDPLAQELLASGIPARLAYIGQDGAPRVVPVGFYWNGRQIVICTASTAPKVRALMADPRVALTIDTDDAPAKALSVRGTASVEVVDGVPDEYLKASAKRRTEQQAQEFESMVRGVYQQMARITIEPEWARVYDFGRGRLPGFLLRLASGNES